MILIKNSFRRMYRTIARLALAGLLLLSIVLLPVGAQAGRNAAGKDPLWGASLKNTPGWLQMVDAPAQIYSEYELTSLAGHLIAYKTVDASDCPAGGLMTDGSANVCGLQLALPAVFAWQNQYNLSILDTSNQTGIPPVVLKNIFTWESQFWPETIYVNTYEYGLGHITEMGADSALRWNAPFYDQVCASSLSSETCKKAYPDQPDAIRANLRGVVIQQAKADCFGCDYGLDMPLAERSIPIFAQTLLANASFVKWYVGGLTGHPAADSVKYEDLWKFTLTSYNAGPGCFMTAFSRTMSSKLPLDWDNFAGQLDPGCTGSLDYVSFISNNDHYHPENDPAMLPPTPTETAVGVPTEIVSETATPTLPVTDVTASATTDITGSPTATATAGPTSDGTATATITTDMTGLPTDLSTPLATATEGTPQPATLTPAETPTSPVTDHSATAVPSSTTAITATATLAETATETATSAPTATETALPTATPQDLSAQLDAPHVKNEVLLKINPIYRDAALATIKSLGISLSEDSSRIDSLDTLIIQVEPTALEGVLAALQASGGVEFAEPNYLAALASTPNDPEFPRQGNLQAIQAPQTWDAMPSMQEVLVAVVDTGVDVNHPDLADTIWQNEGETGLDASGNDKRSNGIDDDGNGYVDDWQGWNMVAGNNNPADDQSHGTHLAGIIAARMNNGIGIAGVAPNARILPVKVLDKTGYGDYAQVAEGIMYATDMGARVINLGFGGTGSSELLQNAIDYALAHNVIVVASAGNSGNATTYFPAAYPGVLAVSAVDNNGYWANFSSSGDHISLAAPGLGIYSTTPGGFFRSMSGTSMAAAHVSGVAALLASQPQFVDANSLRSALVGGAQDRGDAGRDPFFGYGVVQAYNSLAYAGPVMPTATPWAVPTSTPGGVDGVFAMATENLWATTQTYPGVFTLNNPGGSIDSAFNASSADLTGPLGSATRRWTFTTFGDTTLTTMARVRVGLRYYMSGWTDDTYYIQVYEPTNPACGGVGGNFGWCTRFTLKFVPTNANEGQPFTGALRLLTIDVTDLLNTQAKVNNAQVRIAGAGLSGASVDNVTVYVDEIQIRVEDVLPTPIPPTATPIFVPTSTLPPSRATTATPQAGEPHNNISVASADLCATCHRSHTAKSMSLRNATGEEQVCFACHTSGGSGTNVQPAFTSQSNTVNRFFSHPVSNSLNIHKLDETVGGNFGGGNRHVECEDCHVPHISSRGVAANPAPMIQQEMFNSSGVDATWDDLTKLMTYTWMPTADREYQLCFKCHSAFANTLPTYAADGYGWNGSSASAGIIPNGLGKLDKTSNLQVPDSRNLAKEFNSFQVSFHPVEALGRNRNMPTESFVTGWSQDSIVSCSDCHKNNNPASGGNGPHGSSLLHILDGSSNYITQNDPAVDCTQGACGSIHNAGELCFKCHQYNTYSTGTNPVATTRFRKGTENLHAFHNFGTCYSCHDTHGSEQAHLINFDTTEVLINNGSDSQSAWQFNDATGSGTCAIACHGANHGQTESYNP